MSNFGSPWDDMPNAVDVIPPPPGATFLTSPYTQPRVNNGTPYPQFATHLPSANVPSSPPWATTPIPPSSYPPWQGTAPVAPTPAGSYGPPSPASFGPTTPMSGYTPLSYATPQPITATPYFNAVRPAGGALGLTASPMLDTYGYPLSRTPSGSGRKKKRNVVGTLMGKSASVGGRGDYQPWNGPEVYSLKNLARRPRDWRPDYNPRSGIASFISLGRHRSDVPEYTDPVKRTLNALISYKPGDPNMYWNLRLPPHPGSVEFMKLSRPYNQIDMLQLATSPPAGQMRLYHPRLPWYIDIFPTTPNGITIEDVLITIYKQLSTQIHQRHYYNEELDDAHRGVLSAAFSDRCGNRRSESERGILQVDFLADKFILFGIIKGKNGMWELRTGEDD